MKSLHCCVIPNSQFAGFVRVELCATVVFFGGELIKIAERVIALDSADASPPQGNESEIFAGI